MARREAVLIDSADGTVEVRGDKPQTSLAGVQLRCNQPDITRVIYRRRSYVIYVAREKASRELTRERTD